MPYRITIQKFTAGYGLYWTNRYLTTISNMADAKGVMDRLVAAERVLYTSGTVITNGRVDDNVEDTDEYATTAYNLPGTRAAVATDFIAPWVVGRVVFSVADLGRPLQKYIRMFVSEGDTAGPFALSSAAMAILNQYATAVVAEPICDPAGNLVVAGAAFPNVAMRQLRRGKKKKDTPSSP